MSIHTDGCMFIMGVYQSDPGYGMEWICIALGVRSNVCNCMDSREHVGAGMCKIVLRPQSKDGRLLRPVKLSYVLSKLLTSGRLVGPEEQVLDLTDQQPPSYDGVLPESCHESGVVCHEV